MDGSKDDNNSNNDDVFIGIERGGGGRRERRFMSRKNSWAEEELSESKPKLISNHHYQYHKESTSQTMSTTSYALLWKTNKNGNGKRIVIGQIGLTFAAIFFANQTCIDPCVEMCQSFLIVKLKARPIIINTNKIKIVSLNFRNFFLSNDCII